MGPGLPARWEWILLGALCLGCALFWAAHYHQFLIQASDYGQIERTAKEIWAGQLPSHYKRMPMYPILIGLVAPFIPAEHPQLEAALGLNIAFSVGILILLFVFARRLIGVAVFVPLLILPATSVFHRSAVRPLMEPSLGFFILLTFFLFSIRSRWQYLAAFAAAICRYEAAALIAILFVLNWATDRKLWKHFALAALASTGFVTWMALSLIHSRSGNPYFDFLRQTGVNLIPSVPLRIVREPYWHLGNHIIFDVIVFSLFLLGIVVSLQRFRLQSIALLAFLAIYVTIHIAYGVYVTRYAHTVLWIPLLYQTVGATVLLTAAWQWVAARRWPAGVWPALCALALAAAVFVFWKWNLLEKVTFDQGVVTPVVYLGFFVLLLVLALVFGIQVTRRGSILAALVLGCWFATLFGFVAAPSLRRFASDARRIYYNKYETYLVGQWLEGNIKPDERAVIFLPGQVENPDHFAPGQLISWGSMKAESHEELIEELKSRAVTYVTYSYRPGKPTNPEAERYAYDMYYYTRYKVYLAEPFKRGADMPHFEHLATIPLPEWMQYPPVQIYRFLDGPVVRSAGSAESRGTAGIAGALMYNRKG